MKKVLTSLLFAALTLPGFAQLSTRTNDALNEPLGARPQAGAMALTFGLDLGGLFGGDSTVASLDNSNNLASGNPLTFRYYNTNDVVYRAGIRLYKSSEKFTGSTDSTTQANGGGQDFTLTDREYRSSMREYVLIPGIEKHFSAANIFDVYIGGDLYLGFRKDMTIDNTERSNGDFDKLTQKTGSAVIGLGGVVGFNVPIAQLPIALGLEYGWNAKWTKGGKTQNEVDKKSGSTTTNLTYYTQDGDSNAYKDLKTSRFGMDTNQNVRLVLNIYFNRN